MAKSHFSSVLASGWNLVSRPSNSVVEMLGNWFSKCFFALCWAGGWRAAGAVLWCRAGVRNLAW